MRGSNYVVIPLLKINCFIKLCFVLFFKVHQRPDPRTKRCLQRKSLISYLSLFRTSHQMMCSMFDQCVHPKYLFSMFIAEV